MTLEQIHLLDLIAADVHPDLAGILTDQATRIEYLESQVRRLNRIVAGLTERVESPVLVQSGPYDPRD